MNDIILDVQDIQMQDIVCKAVAQNPELNVIDLYNKIYQNFEIDSLTTVSKIFNLIKKNKNIFAT